MTFLILPKNVRTFFYDASAIATISAIGTPALNHIRPDPRKVIRQAGKEITQRIFTPHEALFEAAKKGAKAQKIKI